MIAPFRLQAGDRVPVQQSTTTCGSASLTVARMLVDAAFARWIRLGLDRDAKDDDVPDAQTVEQRFAAHEQVVARRTNALVGAGGRIQCPWPRALGTPPWGAIGELEYGAAVPWADYDIEWFRFVRRGTLEESYTSLQRRVRDGVRHATRLGNAACAADVERDEARGALAVTRDGLRQFDAHFADRGGYGPVVAAAGAEIGGRGRDREAVNAPDEWIAGKQAVRRERHSRRQ